LSPEPQAPSLELVLPRRPSAVRVVELDAARFAAERRQQDLDEAFRRGVAEGERRALTGAAGALDLAAQRLDEAREKAGPELVSAAIDLATEIARAVVRCEIAAGRHGIEKIVRETLAASGVGRGACVVHIHPRDLERLRGVPFRSGTVLEADPEVVEGDVHVTTPHGVLVRDVGPTLDAVRERLHGELT